MSAARATHSAADERRIDRLHVLAGKLLGPGAAVGVSKERGEWVARVDDATGKTILVASADRKSRALIILIDSLEAGGAK